MASPSSGRAELRELLRLGLPVMGAQVFQMGMGVTDTAMSGRYSPTDLAGVALANIGVTVPVTILTMGAVHAVTPIVAQLHGAGRASAIGAEVRQGVWLALIVAGAAIGVLANLGPVFGLFGAEPEVARISRGYIGARLWGYPALALYFVFLHACEGQGRTRPGLVISGVMLIANAALNYAFIYGNFGAPELGGVGTGVATTVVHWLQLSGILLVLTAPFYRRARMFAGSWRPDLEAFRRFAWIGVPIGLTAFFEMGLFSLVTLLLARFGPEIVSAHSIALSMNGVAVMIPGGLAVAATIRVGHGVGARSYEQARLSGQVAVRAGFVCAAILAIVFAGLRHQIASLYTHSVETIAIAEILLLFLAGYLIVDLTQIIAMGALRGYKDTRVPMFLALIAYWVFAFPIALALGFGWGSFEGWGVYGLWTGLTLGLAFGAVAINVRRIRLGDDVARIEWLAGDGER